ncbi:MAG: hypothetical protein KIT31_22770 [Deltaproteobacteria bacterium]|nr:hypothetical protein [Deltaproteobacteria bacterium]
MPILVALAGVADAKKLLVTRADSTADYETRKRVEAAVIGLARAVDRGVGITEVTFGDLALASGCTGNFAACKDTIADSLSVDEIVQITIVPTGRDAVTVVVRRGGKNVPAREASGRIPTATVEEAMTAQIGPLFGTRKLDAAPAKAPPPPPPPVPASLRPAPPPAVETRPVATEPVAVEPAATAVAVAGGEGEPVAAPPAGDERVDGGRRGNRAYLAGAIGGGVLVLGGLLLWQHARDLEKEIAEAPRTTSADLARIVDLEARGDRAALLGNLAVLGGAAVAGVCTYLYVRSGRRHGAVAMPLVVDGGGGIAVRWGGLP